MPKAHEDWFAGKEYLEDNDEHEFKMEHNPDEKDVSGEDKHFGKTADEDDTHLKDTSEVEEQEPEHGGNEHHEEHKEENPFEEEEPEIEPGQEKFAQGGEHHEDAHAHHDPTVDG